MNNNFKKIKALIVAALIAGIYVSLCVIFAPISFGAVQVRISEVLTILPIFTPSAIWGVTVGCLISNILSFSPWDMLLGTLATLVSAICTYKLRNIRFKGLPILAAIPPIIINAVVVGLEITYIFMPESASLAVLFMNMASVFVGQFISCFIIGLPLAKLIEKSPTLKKLISED